VNKFIGICISLVMLAPAPLSAQVGEADTDLALVARKIEIQENIIKAIKLEILITRSAYNEDVIEQDLTLEYVCKIAEHRLEAYKDDPIIEPMWRRKIYRRFCEGVS